MKDEMDSKLFFQCREGVNERVEFTSVDINIDWISAVNGSVN